MKQCIDLVIMHIIHDARSTQHTKYPQTVTDFAAIAGNFLCYILIPYKILCIYIYICAEIRYLKNVRTSRRAT
jgi:hypothetical protein